MRNFNLLFYRSSLLLILFLSTTPSHAQWSKYNNILRSSINSSHALQGEHVSLSNNGRIAIVGGSNDGDRRGAAWIYTFNGVDFVQLGSKLIGTGMSDTSIIWFGCSVSISADGNTAIVGGYGDSNYKGASWIFTFNGSDFVQLGSKIFINEGNNYLWEGYSVGISGDGKTLLIGEANSSPHGASRIYTFDGTNFVTNGNLLVGSGDNGGSDEGWAVALSADGKTAIAGGFVADNFAGAAWIFTFNGTNFVQFGGKLIGTGNIGNAWQGFSVDISDDGKTVIWGGHRDNSSIGAAWVFSFDGNNFVQVGNKLVGSGSIGASQEGYDVAISGDGKTAILGAPYDDTQAGAAWIFTFDGNNFVQASDKITEAGDQYKQYEVGRSVDLSYDGKYALIGVPGINSYIGGARIYGPCINPRISNTTITSSVCTEGNVSLSITATGSDLAFQWYKNGNLMPGYTTMGFTINSVTSSDNGIYTCVASNVCGIVTTSGIYVTVNPLPTVTGIVSPSSVCYGDQVTISGSGATSYSLSDGIIPNKGFVPSFFETFTLTGIDSNGCANSVKVIPNVNIRPYMVISGNKSICKGNMANITITGATTYNWGAGPVSSPFSIASTSPTIYLITGTGSNGCTNTTSLTIVVNDNPNIEILGNSFICLGSYVNITASGANTYQWSNGSKNKFISLAPIVTTIYKVTGTSSNGCSTTADVTVAVNNLPKVSLNLSSLNYVCDTLQTIQLSGGKPLGGTYWYKNMNVNTLNISNYNNYAISYQYTDQNGCSNLSSDTLIIIHCTVPGICERPSPPCSCTNTCPPHFKIYTGITPNGDGKNDIWYIDSLYTPNQITILDKWGNPVFEKDDYNNDWDGKQNGNELPAGVYYYILETGQDKKRFAGTVSIVR